MERHIMQKVVIIGIDGATPELIEQWIKERKLLNFNKIQKNGSWGKLESTIPPFSAPAWTSIVTGCNPGKHGIYGFETTDSANTHLVTSNYRKAPAFWNYLTDIGLKNIIVNVPGTYPPEKINGIMITGLLTPSKDSNFTYPKSIKDKLTKEVFGEYELEQMWIEDFPRSYLAKHNPEKLLKQIIKQIESRAKVTKNLMKKYNWDITMVVFRGTDTLQHFLMNRKDLLIKCYQKIDQLIGEIIEFNPDATFFIISDHGFEKIKGILYPDNVLYNAGLLKPIKDQYNSSLSIMWYFISKIWNKMLNLLPGKTIKNSSFIRTILFSESSKNKLIDFSKTKAFSTADGRGIQIAKKGKYPQGIVNLKDYEKICKDISLLFLELKDPDTDERIIDKIYRWNEAYGKEAINPPDLIFNLKSGYTSLEWIRTPDNINEILEFKRKAIPYIFKNDPIGRSGDHASCGIIFAYGKNIKKDYNINKASVEDILPTVLTTIGLSIPTNIDGKPINEIFIKKPKVKTVNWKSYSSNKYTLSKTERNKIRKIKNMLN
jgi:predicted AlkP superfamily phosphohydrolase/phosphomutase